MQNKGEERASTRTFSASGARTTRAVLLSAVAFLFTTALTRPASAEERKSFVVSWITQAVHSVDGDCPGGVEPTRDDMIRRFLKDNHGKSPEEIDALMKPLENVLNGLGSTCTIHTCPATRLVMFRGKANGKPASAYDHPTSVPDPMIHTVASKVAPGFNLDGKEDANSFTDPVTGEKGVDNQYFRALGCITTHRAQYPVRPVQWGYAWDSQRGAMRPWLLTIVGNDLSKDGPVKLIVDKGLEPAALDGKGETASNQTFRIDPDPRSHNEFEGQIKNRVLTITPSRLKAVGDPFVIPIWDIKNVHFRLSLKEDGSIDGIMGGYQEWLPIYFMYAQGSISYEVQNGLNIAGIYHALKRMADADPHPKTGQNMAISAVYRIEAVPAFAVPVNEKATSKRSAAVSGYTQ